MKPSKSLKANMAGQRFIATVLIMVVFVGCGKPKLELKDQTEGRSAIHLLELVPQFTVSGKKMRDQNRLQNLGLSEGIRNSLYSLIGQRFYGKESFINSV